MTKRDYERAATIVQEWTPGDVGHEILANTFVRFFAADNPRFDEARFRAACVSGANVRAKPRKGA